MNFLQTIPLTGSVCCHNASMINSIMSNWLSGRKSFLNIRNFGNFKHNTKPDITKEEYFNNLIF